MISHKYKCIFIHPNRNGGKSIEKALFEADPTFGSADHKTILQWKNSVSKKVYNSYFKFMFCRNPWDRLISIYHYSLENWRHLYPDDINIPMMFSSFNTFINLCHSKRTPTKSQSHWIKINNISQMDFVGRFENYNDDWKLVCEILGVEIELPHLNQSMHNSYMDYYTPELIEMVAKKFKEDIWSFNYEYPK